MGIIKKSSALSRCAPSCNLKSQIADTTHKMFGLDQGDMDKEPDLYIATKGLPLEGNIVTRRMSLHCLPSSSSTKCFRHQNIQTVFITLLLKILSLTNFKSNC